MSAWRVESDVAVDHPAGRACRRRSQRPGSRAWSRSWPRSSPTTAVNAEYRHLVVDCSEAAATAQPGQFFQLLCPQPAGEQPFLRRPMSLYGADPANRQVEFLYKVTGAGTRGLDTLKPGDHLDIMGPLGTGFTLDPSWRHIVAIGRGAGLADARRRWRKAAKAKRHRRHRDLQRAAAGASGFRRSVHEPRRRRRSPVTDSESDQRAGAMSSAFCAA